MGEIELGRLRRSFAHVRIVECNDIMHRICKSAPFDKARRHAILFWLPSKVPAFSVQPHLVITSETCDTIKHSKENKH